MIHAEKFLEDHKFLEPLLKEALAVIKVLFRADARCTLEVRDNQLWCIINTTLDPDTVIALMDHFDEYWVQHVGKVRLMQDKLAFTIRHQERQMRLPVAGETWVHQKSGECYKIVCVARQEIDQTLTVVYQGERGDIWVRKMDNFLHMTEHGQRFILSNNRKLGGL